MNYKFINVSDEKIKQAENAIRKNGGKVYIGDKFEIMGVRGFYQRSGNDLIISITDKPWLASWGMIEEKLSEFFR